MKFIYFTLHCTNTDLFICFISFFILVFYQCLDTVLFRKWCAPPSFISFLDILNMDKLYARVCGKKFFYLWNALKAVIIRYYYFISIFLIARMLIDDEGDKVRWTPIIEPLLNFFNYNYFKSLDQLIWINTAFLSTRLS